MPATSQKSIYHSNSLNETLQGMSHVIVYFLSKVKSSKVCDKVKLSRTFLCREKFIKCFTKILQLKHVNDFKNESSNYTDNLPECDTAGVFSLAKCAYLRNGKKLEHSLEDRIFNCCLNNASVYGVLNGHCGSRAVDYAHRELLSEIRQVTWNSNASDSEIKDHFKRIFQKIEHSYCQTIDALLTDKEVLKVQIEGLEPREALRKYPRIVQQLNAVTAEIESGATAVIALVLENKLYIANVGDCRAIFCKVDENRMQLHYQLTIDHNFGNENERLRLLQLGVSEESLLEAINKRHSVTRCIGNYTIKGGYKEFGNLSNASGEPVIAEPEVIGGIELDVNCKFLILMSCGLYQALEQATGVQNANSKIVELVNEELLKQSSLDEAVKAVVNKVAEIHYNSCRSSRMRGTHNRPTMTLLVKKFENADTSSNIIEHETTEAIASVNCTLEPDDKNETPQNGIPSSNGISSSSQLDDSDSIAPYVDFTDFYAAMEEAFQKNEVPEDWRQR